jgi:hypothetical protein
MKTVTDTSVMLHFELMLKFSSPLTVLFACVYSTSTVMIYYIIQVIWCKNFWDVILHFNYPSFQI